MLLARLVLFEGITSRGIEPATSHIRVEPRCIGGPIHLSAATTALGLIYLLLISQTDRHLVQIILMLHDQGSLLKRTAVERSDRQRVHLELRAGPLLVSLEHHQV